ncbi:glycosyltransferase [Bacillus mangrovi]|uniref:4,4'-diaponeurosporenoate glycosyltransferase n=1 Tax=Metabacillus mangrovi TaxID=1491830 RepID=A0A7X2S4L9_9BACI|nr:glycosyltransferase family 2 protein [Metabacillus mangrovi]MTH53153.1 glycosyltransferase [Metabacillus mangrovi]
MAMIIAALLAGLFLFWRIPAFEAIPSDSSRRLVKDKLTIIIPARNEEENLQILFQSIASQSETPFEIIVADDGSEDHTAAVAEKNGAAVIKVPELPEGWKGKSWACWNGALQASGEWLLFMDADTYFEKNGMARLTGLFRHIERKSVLTVHPFHAMQKPYETGSALFHLMTVGAIGAFAPAWARKKGNGAFGQALLCRREDYFGWGGHESIKDEVVETMAMGKKITESGKAILYASGRKAISMRMYPEGPVSMFNGWAKSFASGAAAAKIRFLLLSSIWLGGLFSFWAKIPVLFTNEWPAYLLLYTAAVIQLSSALAKFGRFPIWSILLFPLHLLFFLTVFCFSLYKTFIRKNAVWKGRKISGGQEGASRK